MVGYVVWLGIPMEDMVVAVPAAFATAQPQLASDHLAPTDASVSALAL